MSACGKGQQTTYQDSRAIRRLQRSVDQPMGAVVADRLASQQLQRRHDRRQQVIEVMGDAAAQLTHHFDLARLVQQRNGRLALGHHGGDALFETLVEFDQLMFSANPRGDVDANKQQAAEVLLRVEQRRHVGLHPDDGAVCEDMVLGQLKRRFGGQECLVEHRLRIGWQVFL